MPSDPDIWPFRRFRNHFKRAATEIPDRRFAWILGAGASKPSDIPTGGELVERWLKELQADYSDGREPLKVWATAENLEIPDFRYEDRASFYPQVYERRFRGDPQAGYSYLETVMSNKDPCPGYSILATILAKGVHNVVVTTNFDNLVADALAIYTNTFPLVCGHESLTGFVRLVMRRPVVCKIHRDLLLAPQSDPKSLTKLDDAWTPALERLFHVYTPIVIGYGGNDGTLMRFLESLPAGRINGKMLWCYYDDDPGPSERIREVVSRHRGALVPVPGFDGLMIALGEDLGIGPLDTFIEQRAKSRVDNYRKQWEKLSAKKAEAGVTTAPESSRTQVASAVRATLERAEGWWSYVLKARDEKDPTKAEGLYREAIQKYPNNAALLGNFAMFMKNVRKDNDQAEKLYRRALELDPNDAIHTGNFAAFMWKVREDYDQAEKLFRRALELDPNHAELTGNFALFMKNVRKDYDQAEKLFRRALELDPNDADDTGRFALFMYEVRKDYDYAEMLYRRALELDPSDAVHTCNFASFQVRVRKNYDQAEKLYRRALELDPNNASITGNFALFLAGIRKDYDQAERLFCRALELSSNDPYQTGSFALFLVGVRKDYDQAEKLFRRALELDPNHTELTDNFALFMKNVRKDYDQAEKLFRRALELDPNNATNTGGFALFMQNVRKDYDQAEALYRRALELDPNNANIAANLAYLLLAKGCKEDALSCALKAWSLDQDPRRQASAEAALYAGLVLLYTGRSDLPALGRLKTLLSSGFERGMWDFGLLWPDAVKRISGEDLSLYKALAAAIPDAAAVPALDQHARWKEAKAIPTDYPWNL